MALHEPVTLWTDLSRKGSISGDSRLQGLARAARVLDCVRGKGSCSEYAGSIMPHPRRMSSRVPGADPEARNPSAPATQGLAAVPARSLKGSKPRRDRPPLRRQPPSDGPARQEPSRQPIFPTRPPPHKQHWSPRLCESPTASSFLHQQVEIANLPRIAGANQSLRMPDDLRFPQPGNRHKRQRGSGRPRPGWARLSSAYHRCVARSTFRALKAGGAPPK